MTSRRTIRCLGGGVLLLAIALDARAARPPPTVPYAQTPLAPSAIPKFAQPLPLLAADDTTGLRAVVANGDRLTLRMCEFDTTILPAGTFGKGTPAPRTRVWGYAVDACPGGSSRASYLGPAIVATRATPTEILFVNELGSTATTGVLAWRTSTDQTLHWADPLHAGTDQENACAHRASMPMAMGVLSEGYCARNYDGPIPAVPHLHGGEVPPVLDGGPDAWFTSDGAYHGSTYYTRHETDASNAAVYRYPNTQEAAPIWFHDHALGATRLNVYAGLAGAYHIEDPDALHPSFPAVTDLVPLIIQDRMFDTNGQLLFQAGVSGGVLWALNPEHPYWSPEFVGDTIVVNGKAWPNLDVEQRRYRFLFLNGSNARTYELFLVDRVTKAVGPNLWVVATDGGYLDDPVLLDARNARQKLVLMPGERYEVIVDFAGVAPGTRLILKNVAKTPYPAGEAPHGASTGQIMQLTVKAATSADGTYDPASGQPIRRAADGVIERPMVRLVSFSTGTANVAPVRSRQLTLNEVMGMTSWTLTTELYTGSSVIGTAPLAVTYPGGPLEILLNNTRWVAPTTEAPQEGVTEVWEIVNLTADAHPIHLHLVQFQILNRQAFAAARYQAAYGALFPSGVYEPGAGPPGPYDNGGATTWVPGVANGEAIPFVGGNPAVWPYLRGPALPPAAQEAGWKDTAQAPPGTVTRLMVRWAPTDVPLDASGEELAFPFDPSARGGGYVWHCHIIDHEDNEMMRRTSVSPLITEEVRAYRLGVDY